MNIFIIYLSLTAVIGSTMAAHYCSASLCNSGIKHVACDHNGKFAHTCPADAAIVKMEHSLRDAIVHGHNIKRNLVAGGSVPHHKPACRMATMKWDHELASMAALNVRQCAMSHDTCRNTKHFRYSGQNLAWASFTGTPNNADLFQKALDMWFDEYKHSHMKYIDSYPSHYYGPTIGHFTVMVADRNIRVGCAAATYSLPGASYKTYLMACNYATTNMKNFPIYASCHNAGTSCRKGMNPKYPFLCSKWEVYDVNKWH